jgi:hypothetical protein
MSSIDPDNPLAVEIQQEKAQAYFAACRKMVDCLEALKAFDDHRTPRDDRQPGPGVELVEEAAERVHSVLIQREAMKLGYPEKFFEDYDVPAEVRARLGTTRRR